MKDSIILVSGGLKSYVAWQYLNNPQGLFCVLTDKDIKNKDAVLNLMPDTIIEEKLDLTSWLGSETALYKDIFLSLIASRYGTDIYFGHTFTEDIVKNAKQEFIRNSLAAVLMQYKDVIYKIRSPWKDMDLTDVVSWYIGAKKNDDALLKTHSCFNRVDKHCGICEGCIERYIALELNGIKDDYISDPAESVLLQGMIKNIKVGSEKRKERLRSLQS